jgi:pyridoxal phosphate enzyme (YggS family)
MTGLIAHRIQEIRQEIPSQVRLIAVTKQVSVESMREAYDAGIRDFGENRLQEALEKKEQLQDLKDISWHFIGHVQTNKAKKVLESFQWIHSVDSLKLALHLETLAAQGDYSPQFCLQVKILPDENKYGWSVEQLLIDLPQLDQYSHLNIQGLMTILPLGLSQTQMLETFIKTRQLAEKIKQMGLANIQMHQLSMGMSGDYLLAVKAGATMVRLGQK